MDVNEGKKTGREGVREKWTEEKEKKESRRKNQSKIFKPVYQTSKWGLGILIESERKMIEKKEVRDKKRADKKERI